MWAIDFLLPPSQSDGGHHDGAYCTTLSFYKGVWPRVHAALDNSSTTACSAGRSACTCCGSCHFIVYYFPPTPLHTQLHSHHGISGNFHREALTTCFSAVLPAAKIRRRSVKSWAITTRPGQGTHRRRTRPPVHRAGTTRRPESAASPRPTSTTSGIPTAPPRSSGSSLSTCRNFRSRLGPV